MTQSTFDDVLEAIDHLPIDKQADLVDIVRRRLAERGHQRVVSEVREGQAEFKSGTAMPASIDDLMREIGS